jgi:urea transport system ATP-binding protein
VRYLEVSALCSGYGSTRILNEVSLEVDAGEVVALFGRNGVGKTTLLKTILSYLPVNEGDVRIAGSEVSRLSTHAIIRLGVAYVAQERALFANLTVRENLALAGRGAGRDQIESALDLFPRIGERLDQRAGTLSGGEQKMLLLTRTLASAAELVLLDEIVEGVQPNLLGWFQDGIGRLRAAGACLLLVEQNLAFALPIADRYYVMSGGRIVESSDVDDGAHERIRRHLVL